MGTLFTRQAAGNSVKPYDYRLYEECLLAQAPKDKPDKLKKPEKQQSYTEKYGS